MGGGRLAAGGGGPGVRTCRSVSFAARPQQASRLVNCLSPRAVALSGVPPQANWVSRHIKGCTVVAEKEGDLLHGGMSRMRARLATAARAPAPFG